MCLVKEESTFGLNRDGDNFQSRGPLQYYKWWESGSLWGDKCVADYGYNDIENDRQQVECADRLLTEDFKYIKRWTSSKKCL